MIHDLRKRTSGTMTAIWLGRDKRLHQVVLVVMVVVMIVFGQQLLEDASLIFIMKKQMIVIIQLKIIRLH